MKIYRGMAAIALLLMAVVQAFAANGTTSFNECSDLFVIQKSTYKPAEFIPNWGVATAAGLTSNPMPKDFTGTELGDLLTDPYVMEVIQLVAVMVAFLVLFLSAYCCYMCCRKICCKCCKCCGPFQKPIPLKILMVFWFAVVVVASLTGMSGRGKFIETSTSFADAGNLVKTNMDWFVDKLSDINAAANTMVTAAELLTGGDSGVCAFAYDPTDVEERAVAMRANSAINDVTVALLDSLNTTSAGVASASTEVTIIKTDISGQIDNVTDIVDAYMVGYVEPATLGLALVFVFLAGLGIIATMMSKGVRKWMYGTMICLSWPIIMLMILLMAVELLLSVVLSDTCLPSPLTNIADFAPDMAGGNTTIGFYITCVGTNPLAEQVLENGDNYNQLVRDMCNVTNAIGSDEYEYTSPITNTKRSIKKKTGSACKEALTTLGGGLSSVMNTGGEFASAGMSCQLLNAPLGVLLEQGLCNSLAGGLYSMYAAQVCTVVFMLIGLYMVQPAWSQLDGPKDSKVTPDGAAGTGKTIGAPGGSTAHKKKKNKKHKKKTDGANDVHMVQIK